MLTPLVRRVISRTRSLNRFRALGAIRAWPLPAREAEPQKLPLLRSATALFASFTLSLSFLRDESRDALHHPLPGPFAADVDVAVVRVSHEPVPASLQLPVEFVEHDVRLSRGERDRLAASPLTLGLTNPFSITPAFRNARMSFSSRLSSTRLAIWPISLSWLTRSKNFSKSRSTTQR